MIGSLRSLRLRGQQLPELPPTWRVLSLGMDRRTELERIGAERLAASREADRDSRIALIKAMLGTIAWCVIGVTILGFAFHTGDEKTGWVFFWGGLLVGYSGMFWTLHWYYKSGIDRGDW